MLPEVVDKKDLSKRTKSLKKWAYWCQDSYHLESNNRHIKVRDLNQVFIQMNRNSIST